MTENKDERDIDMDDIEIENEVKIEDRSGKGNSNRNQNKNLGNDFGAEKNKISGKNNININSSDNQPNMPNRKDVFAMEIGDETDNDLRPMDEKFKVPSNLKKTFICSLTLFLIGSILIILGCIQQVAAADPGKGITFWVLGSIVMIPGGYYSYQFYKAKKARNEEERNDILENIPEL
jgi:hypothetical protein